MKRRDFLKIVGGCSLSLVAPNALTATAASPSTCTSPSNILLLVELKGGNDGLNTIIPYRDSLYYHLRPNIAVPRDQVVPLNDNLGMHPSLRSLQSMWLEHELAIALGVGYSQPNLSHFRSIEIWNTASDSDEVLETGWLVRLLSQCAVSSQWLAYGVSLDVDTGPLSGVGAKTIVIKNPHGYLRHAKRMQGVAAQSSNAALQHILNVRKDIQQTAVTLDLKLRKANPIKVTFPDTPIGRQLKTAAQLILARVPVAVIKVSLTGFDTHSNQRNIHDRLLLQLAESLTALRSSLLESGDWQRTLVLTYSEFGRRAEENGSRGTDHGTAAPQLILGGRVIGGFYGQQPALSSLDSGNLVYSVDYRSVYATVAQKWWGLSTNSLAPAIPLRFLKA